VIDRVVSTPRPVPGRLLPALAGGTVVALALPIFLLGGWPLAGWALGATLWSGGQALGLLLARVRAGGTNVAGSGVLGVGMMFRAVAVMAVLLAVAASDGSLAVGAAVVYALAYTLELALSVVTYFGSTA
jgi:hypothetical protein